jgi:hypothetical protein
MAGEVFKTVKSTKQTWWHWKRWYKSYMDGRFDKEVELLVPDLATIKGLKYEKFDYGDRITRQINKNMKNRRRYNKYVKKYGLARE